MPANQRIVSSAIASSAMGLSSHFPRAITTPAGTCMGARGRDFLRGIRRGQSAGAQILYGRSRARLPTGHPSWPVCRGTDPRLVLVARVHGWSLPTGRLARSAYTGTDRALPDTGARIRGGAALTPTPRQG